MAATKGEFLKVQYQNELSVITKAKDLCSYIMTVTQKSPKHFRYTFVSRLQNLSLDIIEKLYRANDIFINKNDMNSIQKRLHLQHEALTSVRLLAYFSQLAMEQGCLIFKQFQQISKYTTDCINMIGGWINSDRKRYMS